MTKRLIDIVGREKKKFIQRVLDIRNAKPEKLTFPRWLSRKYDGVFAIAWKADNKTVRICSATGEPYISMKHLEKFFCPVMVVNSLIVFEVYDPALSFPTISGQARDTKQQHTNLKAYVHDWLTLGEFLGSSKCRPFGIRYASVCHFHEIDPKQTYVVVVEQKHCPTFEVAYGMFLQTIEDGGEGIVLSDPTAPYQPGERNHTKVKMKGTLTYDLKVVGVMEGIGRLKGKAGALTVEFFDGELISVGSGLDDSQRDTFFKEPEKIVGSIIEIEAMRDSTKGKLREPRFKAIRYDKVESDVDLENRMGRLATALGSFPVPKGIGEARTA
nr:hypothetical protein [uncultured Anaeromusa sp.]